MSPNTRTAALPPQPFPFLGCWATGGLGPGFGFVGAGGGGAGLGAAAEAFAGAGAGLRGGGGGGAAAGGGLGGCGDIVITSIIRVLAPFSTAAESSVGPTTAETLPNRTRSEERRVGKECRSR